MNVDWNEQLQTVHGAHAELVGTFLQKRKPAYVVAYGDDPQDMAGVIVDEDGFIGRNRVIRNAPVSDAALAYTALA